MAKGGGSLELRCSRQVWATWQDPISTVQFWNFICWLQEISAALHELHDSVHLETRTYGWAGWLTLVIPALWETGVGGSLKSGVQDQLDQLRETSSLLKIQKISQVWW